MTVHTLPRWVTAATALPVRFAQVREDPAIDLYLADRQRTLAGAPIRALVTASGGCTAAALAASGTLESLHLVDPNPAQLALTRVKLHLLLVADPETRARVLGHTRLAPALRGAALGAIFTALRLPAHVLGPPALVAQLGPDNAGRYEQQFAALRRAIGLPVEGLLTSADPARLAAPGTELGGALDRAFDEVFALPNLVALFGEAATANAVEPFARHFAARTRHALATMPTADNPFLWQLLAGAYPETADAPWLTALAPDRMCAVACTPSTMDEVLRAARPGAYDLVHLSNILDWLDPAEAARTLRLAHAALRPGGVVVIRQLNSTLGVRTGDSGFDWDPVADELHAADRSFFYRALHVGVAR